ncbi:MAG: phosphatase PAP2 family protein [Caulobacter sp.]|nr:phosphatase PAP2 family protein [Caulobacter sp.]
MMGDLSFQWGRWRTLARREAGAVVAVLVAAAALWLFLSVAGEVAEGETLKIDRALLLMLRMTHDPTVTVGPLWLRTALMDFTSLGSVAVLTLVVAGTAGLFASLRRWPEAVMLVAASGGGVAISQGLKLMFGRARPDESLRLVEAVNASFPSGHAMLSAVVYLTLGAMISRFAERRRVRAFAMGAGVVLTLLVGTSRVYLGVHWPSDVLAGWSLGAAWAMACWLAVWAWERRWRGPPTGGETSAG